MRGKLVLLIGCLGMLFVVLASSQLSWAREQAVQAPAARPVASRAVPGFPPLAPPHLVDNYAWHMETVDAGEPPGIGQVGAYTSLALDAVGWPHISYLDATHHNLKYAFYDGTGWISQTVDTGGLPGTGHVGTYSSLALDAAGWPHISYHDYETSDLKYATYDGTRWISETVDDHDWVGEHTSLALDAADHPYISYYDSTDQDLELAYHDGLNWQIVTVDDGSGSDNVGWFSALALDAAGRLHISYYNYTAGDLQYAYHDGIDLGQGWQIETVDTGGSSGSGYVGLYTSLALDDAGQPHISYFDYGRGDLKYATYDGTRWLSETVDAIGRVGLYTSLVLDSWGRPYISFYDDTNGDLKLAHHDGTGWQISVVDAGGQVGLYSSLALWAPDRLSLGYYDETNGDLRYGWGCDWVHDIDLSWSPQLPREGMEVSFVGEVQGSSPITINWDLGDGTWATGPVVTHAFTTAGFYTVTMTATNCAGTGLAVVSRPVVVVSSQSVVRYVADDGIDLGMCDEIEDRCRTIPYALSQALWLDEIRVAGGTHQADDTVVTIQKWITLTGSWQPNTFSQQDINAHPTILRAQGGASVMHIVGAIQPTVDSFVLTGGSAEYGGGIVVEGAGLVLHNCILYENAAVYGGGLSLQEPAYAVVLEGNHILSNTASAGGGGISVEQAGPGSPVRLSGNVLRDNVAQGDGGGILLVGGSYTLEQNVVQDNTAQGSGGAIVLFGQVCALEENVIQGNVAQGDAGGMLLSGESCVLKDNVVQDNVAGGDGGGILLSSASISFTYNLLEGNVVTGTGGGLYLDSLTGGFVQGNVISANQALVWGGGLYVNRSPLHLDANLIRANTAAFGSGIVLSGTVGFSFTNNVVYQNAQGLSVGTGSAGGLVNNTFVGESAIPYGVAVQADEGSDLWLTNNILVNQGTAISATLSSTVYARYNLFRGNDADERADDSSAIYNLNPIYGDPRFQNPTGGDFHLGNGSAAADAGYSGELFPPIPDHDMDGEPRPDNGALVDVGADERVMLLAVTIAHDGPTMLGYPTTLVATPTTSMSPLSIWNCSWAFGDETYGSGFRVQHTYPEVATYTVVVTVNSYLWTVVETAEVSVVTPEWFTYLPVVLREHWTSCFPGPWEIEDNDTPEDANGPICAGREYLARPDDASDYFSLDVETVTGTIQVDMWDYTGQGGQLILYDDSQTLVVRDFDPLDGWHVSADVGAGRYYIRVYTSEGHNPSPYRLRADFP